MRSSHPVLIFDLDETVLTINSFPRWVKFMLAGGTVQRPGLRRLRAVFAAGVPLLRRKAGMADHEQLKRQLQRIWQRDTQGDGGRAADRMVALLLPFVRSELAPLLSAIKSDRGDAILATAAAAEYALPLGRSLGFRHILATASDRVPGSASNVGSHKRDAVMDFLAGQRWADRPRILFTDHEDDLPLIAECQTVYWFGSAESGRHVMSAAPDASLRPGALAMAELAGILNGDPGPGRHASRMEAAQP